MRERLLELEAGRCFFRDHRGRVEAVQIELVDPVLLRAFSTHPGPVEAGLIGSLPRAFGLQLAGVLIWTMLLVPGTAARSVAARAARADAPQSASRTGRAPALPQAPPLVSGRARPHRRQEAPGASSPAGKVDPLVSNGLGSPSCSSSARGGTDPGGRRNCETSGFVASADPTGNYGIDVHIDTGLLRPQLRRPPQHRPGPDRDAGLDGARLGRPCAGRDARVVLHAHLLERATAVGVGTGGVRD